MRPGLWIGDTIHGRVALWGPFDDRFWPRGSRCQPVEME